MEVILCIVVKTPTSLYCMYLHVCILCIVNNCTAIASPAFTIYTDWNIKSATLVDYVLAFSAEECQCYCGNNLNCGSFLYDHNDHYKCELRSKINYIVSLWQRCMDWWSDGIQKWR